MHLEHARGFYRRQKILNMLSEVQTYVKIRNIPVFQKKAASDIRQGRRKSAEYQHNLKWENA